ncbi:MAG TPA: hypothetical protein VHD62_18705, partial [Opitutaceae bacterium]|nr:hypothetical protein [Opitutaceae bacterium]
MAIGDGAELFVTGNLSVRADDNIFLANSKTNDTIFNVTPGAELTFGKDADLKGAFTLVDDWTRYADNRRLDTNLASVDFRSNYDDSKMKLQLTAGYHELNQNTPDVRGLIRRNVLSAGGNGEVEIS